MTELDKLHAKLVKFVVTSCMRDICTWRSVLLFFSFGLKYFVAWPNTLLKSKLVYMMSIASDITSTALCQHIGNRSQTMIFNSSYIFNILIWSYYLTIGLFKVVLSLGSQPLLLYKLQFSPNSLVGIVFLYTPHWSKLYRLRSMGQLHIQYT